MDDYMQSVKDYYASFGDKEWRRLSDTSNDGYVEFSITCRQIAKHLKPNSTVLDLGGGPGRYSLWLAEQGHRVVLADLSPNLLDIARTQLSNFPHADHIEEVCEADARDLSRWHDNAFDAVLCLGPFYHLPKIEDRVIATKEICRVMKPEGILIAAFLARLSFLRRTLSLPEEQKHFMDEAWFNNLMDHGHFQNSFQGRFTEGYGATPNEITSHFANLGFQQISLIAAESIAGGINHKLSELRHMNRELHDKIMDTLFSVASEASILGLYGHIVYTGFKERIS